MMVKSKKTLADVMKEDMGLLLEPKPVAIVPVKTNVQTPSATPTNRVGKKHIGAYFEFTAWQQWNILCIEQGGKTTQSMMEEAVNDLFLKYDKSSIA